MDAIFNRRSIRKYTPDLVDEKIIKNIIKAGMAAPSAGNEQPWQFIIINERDKLDKITEVHPYSKMLKQANVTILICGDLSLEKHIGFWVQDCSAATENMLIAVASMGLGSVWLGVYPREDRVDGIKRLLELPDNIIPFALIPVGHPAEEKPPKEEFDESRIHYNGW